MYDETVPQLYDKVTTYRSLHLVRSGLIGLGVVIGCKEDISFHSTAQGGHVVTDHYRHLPQEHHNFDHELINKNFVSRHNDSTRDDFVTLRGSMGTLRRVLTITT